MKSIYIVLLITLLGSCTSGSSKIASLDEVKSDTLITETDSADIDTYDNIDSDPDDGELVQQINDGADSITSAYSSEKFYTIYSSFSGYETGADAKWVVNDDIELQYCEITWSMEGTSGSQTYYFSNEQIVAGDEENFYNDYEELVKIYKQVGTVYGYSRTNGTESDSVINFLQEGDYASKNEEAKSHFTKLLNRILELQDSVIENENDVTIRVENIVNYGEDFTETEEYRINKKVYKSLISANDN